MPVSLALELSEKLIYNGSKLKVWLRMIDELDRQLILELQKDGRQQYVDLARKLGVVEGTVRKRVKRLLQRNLLKIVGVPNVLALGYEYVGIMGVHINMPDIQHVADKLRQYKNVCYLAWVLGRYEFLAIVLAQNREELADFMMHKVANAPGILQTETFTILRVIKGETGLLDTLQLLEDLGSALPDNSQ